MEWFKGIKDPENFKKDLYANSKLLLLQQLVKILEDRLREIETQEVNYDIASWASLQADRNGRRKVLKDLLNLLSFVEK